MKTAFDIINSILEKELDIIKDSKRRTIAKKIVKELNLSKLRVLSLDEIAGESYFYKPEYSLIDNTLESGFDVKRIKNKKNMQFKDEICITFPSLSSYYLIDRNGREYHNKEIIELTNNLSWNVAVTYNNKIIGESKSRIHIINSQGDWLKKQDTDYKAVIWITEENKKKKAYCIYLISREEYEDIYERTYNKKLDI